MLRSEFIVKGGEALKRLLTTIDDVDLSLGLIFAGTWIKFDLAYAMIALGVILLLLGALLKKGKRRG